MKKKFILLFFMSIISVGMSYAEDLAEKLVRESNSIFRMVDGNLIELDNAVVTVKLREGKSLSKDVKVIRSNKLGYIDVEVPNGIDIEDFVAYLRSTGDCELVKYNEIAEIGILSNDTRVANQWYLGAINMYSTWDITTGDPAIKVAVLDNGFDLMHEDIGYGNDNYSNIDSTLGYDYYLMSSTSMTKKNHGTQVAGIVSAKTNNGIGIAGIGGGNGGPGVKILPYCVSSGTETGINMGYVDDAIYLAVAEGAKVINMSFGTTDTILSHHADVVAAIDYAYSQGVTLVSITHNYSLPYITFPACYSKVIAVGAMDSYYQKCYFSNYGSGIELVAPGEDIYSTQKDNDYDYADGTSFAAPQVAGTVALMLSIAPSLTPDSIRQILRSTATHLAGYTYLNNWNSETGYGRLNTYEAVKAVAIPNMEIVGANQLCGSEVYYVKNLPPDCSVEWSFTNAPSSTDTLLQSDYPVDNQCIINIENNENLNATLVAEVYEGTTLIRTLTKQVSTGWLFSGSYVIYDQNNNPRGPSSNFGNGEVIVMAAYDTAELTSSFFAQASISHTPSPDLLWWHSHFLSSIIEIKFTGSNQRTIVTGTDAVSCNNFKFTVRTFYTDPFLMAPYITSSDNMLTIAINGQGDGTEYANGPWNIEILNAVTGQSVLRRGIADSNNSRIDTSGWPSGIYVVKITKNNEIFTQKVSIK